MLSNKAILQVSEVLHSRTMLNRKPYRVAFADSFHGVRLGLQTANSPKQRNQHLLSGYCLWINAVYHLGLILYDKWQIYSFKNGLIQVKVLLSQWANYGFT